MQHLHICTQIHTQLHICRHRRCSWNTLCFESKCRTHTDTEKERHRHTQRHAANSDSPLIFRNLCRNIKYSSTLLRETGTCRISEDHFDLQSMLCRCRTSTWASPRWSAISLKCFLWHGTDVRLNYATLRCNASFLRQTKPIALLMLY